MAETIVYRTQTVTKGVLKYDLDLNGCTCARINGRDNTLQWISVRC